FPNGWTTVVEPHLAFVDGAKLFDASGERVAKPKHELPIVDCRLAICQKCFQPPGFNSQMRAPSEILTPSPAFLTSPMRVNSTPSTLRGRRATSPGLIVNNNSKSSPPCSASCSGSSARRPQSSTTWLSIGNSDDSINAPTPLASHK